MTQDSVFNGEITVGTTRENSADDYWMTYHGLLPHFGPVVIMFSHQQTGQGISECLHQSEKHIITKIRNKLGDKVKETLTEIKMSVIRKRAVEDRRTRHSITQNDTSDEEDLEYDEGFQDERHIWEVTHVSEYYYCDLKIWKRLPRRVTVWIYYLNSQSCGMVTGEQRRDGERFVLS